MPTFSETLEAIVTDLLEEDSAAVHFIVDESGQGASILVPSIFMDDRIQARFHCGEFDFDDWDSSPVDVVMDDIDEWGTGWPRLIVFDNAVSMDWVRSVVHGTWPVAQFVVLVNELRPDMHTSAFTSKIAFHFL